MTRAIGFIGLGLMGQALTKRLVARGHRVTGYDVVPQKVEAAARHGDSRVGPEDDRGVGQLWWVIGARQRPGEFIELPGIGAHGAVRSLTGVEPRVGKRFV